MSNSESNPEAEPKVKTEENSNNVVVVDPDDYQKTQKLKAIDRAKKEYKKVKRNKTEEVEKLERWQNPLEAYRSIRARRLADYGSELLPLLEEAIESGTLEESDLTCDLGRGNSSVKVDRFVRNGGNVYEDDGLTLPRTDGEFGPAPLIICDSVYRQFERLERKLGLGLELEENKGPAEI